MVSRFHYLFMFGLVIGCTTSTTPGSGPPAPQRLPDQYNSDFNSLVALQAQPCGDTQGSGGGTEPYAYDFYDYNSAGQLIKATGHGPTDAQVPFTNEDDYTYDNAGHQVDDKSSLAEDSTVYYLDISSDYDSLGRLVATHAKNWDANDANTATDDTLYMDFDDHGNAGSATEHVTNSNNGDDLTVVWINQWDQYGRQIGVQRYNSDQSVLQWQQMVTYDDAALTETTVVDSFEDDNGSADASTMTFVDTYDAAFHWLSDVATTAGSTDVTVQTNTWDGNELLSSVTTDNGAPSFEDDYLYHCSSSSTSSAPGVSRVRAGARVARPLALQLHRGTGPGMYGMALTN